MKIKYAQPNKKLARLIQELLDLPDLRSATILLRIVLRAMSTALQNGERVYVKGFGIFSIANRTPRPTPHSILTNDKRGIPAGYSPELTYHRQRGTVIFEPSLPFMAMLNFDSPNYKERRTQRRWSPA